MKNIIITVVVLLLLATGVYYFTKDKKVTGPNNPTGTNVEGNNTATTTQVVAEGSELVIGKSVEGRDIQAFNFGTGDERVLFIGGIHGGYSYNTSLLSYELIDYLKENPSAVPSNVKVTIIPVLNPDGLYKVTGKVGRFALADVASSNATQVSGRYNANKVDLSRNFDCNWEPTGKWQTTTVSGGTKAFSEPESDSIRAYFATHDVSASVVFYSAAGGVYSSNCGGEISADTKAITDLYAKASGYKAYSSFDSYETSGDLVNWLAKNNIPAISVLLTNHKDTDWTKNKKGIDALLQKFAK